MPRAGFFLFLTLAAFFVSSGRSEEILLEGNTQVVVERNVPMTTRDGVTLRSDVFRPKADGKYPVILERTPYDKRIETFGPKLVANGYVMIVQDVRGRNASEGEWYPLRHEADDGFDSVEWAAGLPYANGKVGMYGASYVAVTQMFAAMASPPHLACIMPIVAPSNIHEQWVYQGGAFSQALNQGWSSSLAINVLERRVGGSAQPSHWEMKRPPVSYPLLDLGTAAGLADYYFDWLKHPDYDEFWKAWSIEEHFSQIKVPGLHLGGWYDIFQEGTIRNFTGITRQGGSVAARNGQRLVMMVGGHAGPGPKVGEVDYGQGCVVDWGALALRWYDYVMKGVDNGMGKEKPIRLFVMGLNAWDEENAWPVTRAKQARYFLHSSSGANSLKGDGSLSLSPPLAEPADRFVYNPADPVSTLGGPAFGDVHLKQGPFDQREIEKRGDVLVYTTPAFERAVTLVGPVTLDLFVSSSAVDTDFTGKLVDVSPDGVARNVAEGILRVRYRQSREKAVVMEPGKVYRVSVEVGSTAQAFLAGHQIRLEVSSSNFPRFDRNLNTGTDSGSPATAYLSATNSVLHDAGHPSALCVEVLPPE